MYEIKASYKNLCDLITHLIRNKYHNENIISDEQFIENTLSLVKKYNCIKICDHDKRKK